MTQVACIVENEASFAEDRFEVKIYQEGRLIHFKNNYQRMIEAYAALKKYYPDAKLLNEEQFEGYYKSEGYSYPYRYDPWTDFICGNCRKGLRLQQRSLKSAVNTPYGHPWHTYYECIDCNAEYACMTQEFTNGPPYESWIYFAPDKIIRHECVRPNRIPPINSYGFRETHLRRYPLKKEEK